MGAQLEPPLSLTLVTGVAGFIGFHLARALLAQGQRVLGVDNLNDYYDVALKQARLAELQKLEGFRFERLELADGQATAAMFERERPERVVHLAAQAGVRYSVSHPQAYVGSNLVAFVNVLEGCRRQGCEHLLFASSSSVYGDNSGEALNERDATGHPASLYAATKRSNELMAHSYAHLYGLPCTGLRFFSVYGPWGRPDMAMFLFTDAIRAGRPIRVFNNGEMVRGFTFIDDAVRGVMALMGRPAAGDPEWSAATPDPASSLAPYRLYNLGSDSPTPLMQLVRAIEAALGKTAEIQFEPMQPGDVVATCADTQRLLADTGVAPEVGIEEGVRRSVSWYCSFYSEDGDSNY